VFEVKQTVVGTEVCGKFDQADVTLRRSLSRSKHVTPYAEARCSCDIVCTITSSLHEVPAVGNEIETHSGM